MNPKILAGTDFESVQHLLECVWAYEEQMQERNMLDPRDFVNICVQMKALYMEERRSRMSWNPNGQRLTALQELAPLTTIVDSLGTLVLNLPAYQISLLVPESGIIRPTIQQPNVRSSTLAIGGTASTNFEIGRNNQGPTYTSVPAISVYPGNTRSISDNRNGSQGQGIEASNIPPPRENNFPHTSARASEAESRNVQINFGASNVLNTTRRNEDAMQNAETVEETCTICKVAPRDVVLIPCGHLLACSGCAIQIKICPVCMQSIRGLVKTFVS